MGLRSSWSERVLVLCGMCVYIYMCVYLDTYVCSNPSGPQVYLFPVPGPLVGLESTFTGNA